MPPERQAELQADFARNNTHDMLLGLQAYLRWLHRDDDPARRLCETDVPAWVVHAEKGDGALTEHERAVFEACPDVRVVTIPGRVFVSPERGARAHRGCDRPSTRRGLSGYGPFVHCGVVGPGPPASEVCGTCRGACRRDRALKGMSSRSKRRFTTGRQRLEVDAGGGSIGA